MQPALSVILKWLSIYIKDQLYLLLLWLIVEEMMGEPFSHSAIMHLLIRDARPINCSGWNQICLGILQLCIYGAVFPSVFNCFSFHVWMLKVCSYILKRMYQSSVASCICSCISIYMYLTQSRNWTVKLNSKSCCDKIMQGYTFTVYFHLHIKVKDTNKVITLWEHIVHFDLQESVDNWCINSLSLPST